MRTFDDSADVVRTMLQLRADQDMLFGVPLGRGYGWDIILVLFIADAEGRELTGRQAIIRAGVAFEAGKRWLSYIANAGIVLGDGELDPDVVVTLAPYAVSRIEEYVGHIQISRH